MECFVSRWYSCRSFLEYFRASLLKRLSLTRESPGYVLHGDMHPTVFRAHDLKTLGCHELELLLNSRHRSRLGITPRSASTDSALEYLVLETTRSHP
jgi:hypothetical protein